MPYVIVFLIGMKFVVPPAWYGVEKFTILGIIKANIGTGSTFVTNGWFVYALFIMYIGFWLSFRYCKSEVNSLVLNVIYVIGSTLILLYLHMKHGWLQVWWYSNLAFLIGVIVSMNPKKCDDFFDKKGNVFLVFAFALIGQYSYLVTKPLNLLNELWSTNISRFIGGPFFALGIYGLTLKIQPTLKIWDFLAKYSYEIYLVHGFVYIYFGYVMAEYGQVPFVVTVLLVSVLAGILLHYISKEINRLVCQRL